MDLIKLESKYSNQLSFYGKAHTLRDKNNGDITLFSYETEMAKISDGDLYLISDYEGDYSRTTMRHLNEFVRQFSCIGKLGIADIRKALDSDMTIKVKD